MDVLYLANPPSNPLIRREEKYFTISNDKRFSMHALSSSHVNHQSYELRHLRVGREMNGTAGSQWTMCRQAVHLRKNLNRHVIFFISKPEQAHYALKEMNIFMCSGIRSTNALE